MVSQIPYGDPGVASFNSEEHGQVDLWTGPPPRLSTVEPVGESTTLGLYEVVGYDTDGNLVAATFAGPATHAIGVLTFSGTGTEADTVTIDGVVYTLKDTLTPAANEVLIGAAADDTADNLAAAINKTAGGDTLYGDATVRHASVVASRDGTGIVTVTAKIAGEAGNAIATTEAGTGASFAAATLVGGTGEGVKAVGIMGMKAVTGVSEAINADIWRDGMWNPLALTWDASFNTDEKKRKAFQGAPSPTAITIRKNPHDSTFA